MNEQIGIYHLVRAYENFEKASKDIFELVRNAQEKRPNTDRCLILEIEGHRNSKGGFDDDMVELQSEFILKFMSKWLKEISMPLANGKVVKPSQDNDLPLGLEIVDDK